MRLPALWPAVLVTLLLPLQAQRRPDPVDPAQEVQIHDVRGLLLGDTPAARAGEVEHVAAALRRFVEPTLGEQADVRPLGRRRVAVLARSEQQAWIAAALDRAKRGEWAELKISVLEVRESVHAAVVGDRTRGGEVVEQRREGGREGGTVLLRRKYPVAAITSVDVEPVVAALRGDAATAVLGEVSLRTEPLRLARGLVGERVTYVRDYEVKHLVVMVVDPVIAEVLDGTEIEVTTSPRNAGRIGVWLSVNTNRLLDRPIPTFTTSLAGSDAPLTLELPSSRGFSPGAGRRGSGRWRGRAGAARRRGHSPGGRGPGPGRWVAVTIGSARNPPSGREAAAQRRKQPRPESGGTLRCATAPAAPLCGRSLPARACLGGARFATSWVAAPGSRWRWLWRWPIGVWQDLELFDLELPAGLWLREPLRGLRLALRRDGLELLAELEAAQRVLEPLVRGAPALSAKGVRLLCPLAVPDLVCVLTQCSSPAGSPIRPIGNRAREHALGRQ